MQCKICGQDNPPQARFCANCGAALVTTVELPTPAAVPSSPPAAPAVTAEYMGFWIRFVALIIDGVILLIISFILSILTRFIYGLVGMFGIFILWLLYYWLFTGLKGQTPGKMVLGIKVVNARGERPGLGVAALREVLGKTVSTVVLCLGFLWIAWDRQKQGWHDKIADTHVVKAVKQAKAESKE